MQDSGPRGPEFDTPDQAHALWLSAQDAHVLLGLDYITEMNLSMLGKISKQKN